MLPAARARCGQAGTNPDRQYCDLCLSEIKEENTASFAAQGLAAPAGSNHGGSASRKRRNSMAARIAAVIDWEESHGTEYDPAGFATRIPPVIQHLSIGALARATGLSLRYSSIVRRGQKVPHPAQWPAFEAAGRRVAS
jgi:hypothetical protein